MRSIEKAKSRFIVRVNPCDRFFQHRDDGSESEAVCLGKSVALSPHAHVGRRGRLGYRGTSNGTRLCRWHWRSRARGPPSSRSVSPFRCRCFSLPPSVFWAGLQGPHLSDHGSMSRDVILHVSGTFAGKAGDTTPGLCDKAPHTRRGPISPLWQGRKAGPSCAGTRPLRMDSRGGGRRGVTATRTPAARRAHAANSLSPPDGPEGRHPSAFRLRKLTRKEIKPFVQGAWTAGRVSPPNQESV